MSFAVILRQFNQLHPVSFRLILIVPYRLCRRTLRFSDSNFVAISQIYLASRKFLSSIHLKFSIALILGENKVPRYTVLWFLLSLSLLNPLTPKDHYSGRTAPLTSKRCILYTYSANTGTAYFKHGIYSPFFSLQNAVCFTILTYLVPVLFTFYIQDVLKFKKIIQAPKG